MVMDSNLQHKYLMAMGVQQWVPRDSGPLAAEDDSPDLDTPAAANSWQMLEIEVAGCTRCKLHRSRTQTVFGTGDRQADWLIIGEAPGADEDQQGKPFVGRAGQLLDEMLMATGLDRPSVYIANLLKCRPPSNRDPSTDEVACCQGYLQRQIELLQPRLILVVGRVAAQGLLQTTTPVGRLRNKTHYYGERKIPLVVTYHPAYLLRSPLEKRKVWQDLQFAKAVINQPRDA